MSFYSLFRLSRLPNVRGCAVSWEGFRVSRCQSMGSRERVVPVDTPPAAEMDGVEPWMADELIRYYKGKNQLAKMMGESPETFTDIDVQEALRYLLPTRLFAKDARPSMKHPFKIFPDRKEASFDTSGRPLDPGFYTGSPAYHSLVYETFEQQDILRTAGPSSEQEAKVPMTWVKKESLENILAEGLSDKQYSDLIGRLTSLASHPNSSVINSFLDVYRRPVFSYRSSTHIPRPRRDGSVRAMGKRKTATAAVSLIQGSGIVTVNNKELLTYFPRVEDRQQILYPFITTQTIGLYNVTATLKGGGITGQAGALRLAISKALLGFPGDHGDRLEAEGLLVRDPRMVERKKPGQMKARRKFAWVKR